MAARKAMTVDEAFAHIGGLDNFVTDEGLRMVAANIRQYLWKYRDKSCWCTACGQQTATVTGKHATYLDCPECGARVMLLHEARGHSRLYDQLVLYEWRRSAVDPEAVVLTASHAWRNSGRDMPHTSALHVDRQAIYIFRPGSADKFIWQPYGWTKTNGTGAVHTMYAMGWSGAYGCDWVMSTAQLITALRGTRLGETISALHDADGYIDNRRQELPLNVLYGVARRPWLEYLIKCGQRGLAAELVWLPGVPKAVVPNQRARKPADLLGLTEGQWYEVRRDGIALDAETLRRAHLLRALGLGDWRISEIKAMKAASYELKMLARRTGPRHAWEQDTVCDMLEAADVPDKLRRKALRRIIGDIRHSTEWRDYYAAAMNVGENLADTAILLPKDMRTMHDRMVERLRLAKSEEQAAKLAMLAPGFSRRLNDLRKKYTYNAAGLILRPYDSGAEVVREGTALSICIGGYAERYLKGGTILCCLRRAEEPDEPWRAVEFSVSTGQMVQDRGYKNDAQPIDEGTRKQLRLFWALFNRHRRKGARSA